jgi:hypothetical protein
MNRFVPFLLIGALTGSVTGCKPVDDEQNSERKPPSGEGPGGSRRPPDVEPLAKLAEAQKLLREHEQLRQKVLADLPFLPEPDLKKIFGPKICWAGTTLDPASVDVHRSLFVHDQATLDTEKFALSRTLGQLADHITAAGVSGVTAETLFRDLWDTQNQSTGAQNASGPHCDDNGQTINGFPNSCPRAEGAEASGVTPATLDAYRPIALVNRLDLAHEGWRNCGEHRIVYAKTGGGGRNLIIFEAVLPNPNPGCKDGCRPVAEFWAELSQDPTPSSRADKLEKFYYEGLPGFRPVVHVDHYSSTGATSGYGSAGGGQIRTNQFMQQPWTLKEFRTLIDCTGGVCEFQFVPDTVKLNPFGELWAVGDPTDFNGRRQLFQAAIATQVGTLGAADAPTTLGYELANDFNSAQSNAQSPQGDTAYCHHFDCAAGDQYLAAALTTFNTAKPPQQQLEARHVVNRALAVSCGGCHQPAAFGLTAPEALGKSGAALEVWPDSAGFVHTSEQSTVAMPDPSVFGSQPGFALSPALENSFLPARKQNLISFLAAEECLCARKFVAKLPKDKLLRELEIIRQPPIPPDPDIRIDLTLDERLSKLAAESGVEVERPAVLSHQPHVENLGVIGTIEDPDKRKQAREQAIRQRLNEIPSRRTVTGSFRVH